MLLLSVFFVFLSNSQTVYHELPSENLFNLTVTSDGRIQAKIRGGDYYGEGDPYYDVYRSFIELNPHKRTLMIAFAVAELDAKDNAHIMTVTIPSGALRTNPPRNATFPQPNWFNDNMILWYDQKAKAHVMIYQEGCYTCYAQSGMTVDETVQALNQTIFKTVSFDDGTTWHGKIQLLKGKLLNPHVQYQIIPGLETDEEGHSYEVMIPVHHLDLDYDENNFQMLWRTRRAIDPDDGSWTSVNMTSKDDQKDFCGHIQASIVRMDQDKNLVAFLRDLYGQWVYRTISADDGKTWTAQLETPHPNPDLMVQAVYLHSGNIMLFHNPQQSFGSEATLNRNYNSHILAVSISDNAGLSWMSERILEYAYDGMSLYPVALQDPLCDNIYLAWSARTNELPMSCMAFTSSGVKYDLYEKCITQSVDMRFIKFTVIHENWVYDDHNWDYDYEGCIWDIAESLKDEISERKKMYTSVHLKQGWSQSNLDVVQHKSFEIVALLVVLTILICCCVGICFYTKTLFSTGSRGSHMISLA